MLRQILIFCIWNIMFKHFVVNSPQSVWCEAFAPHTANIWTHLNRFKQVLTNASRFWRNSIKVFEHFQRGCKGTRFFSGFPRKNAARCRFFSVKSRNSPQSVWCKGTHRGIEHLNTFEQIQTSFDNHSLQSVVQRHTPRAREPGQIRKSDDMSKGLP